MRTFDPAPLWRSTAGFDRLVNLIDESMVRDVPDAMKRRRIPIIARNDNTK